MLCIKKSAFWALPFILLVIVTGCAHKQPATIALFNYQDFGPQAAAYELLGMQAWSWQKGACCEQKKSHPIAVVVYRNTTLEKAKQAYPIDEKSQLDYRYITYQDAINYLNATIDDAKDAGLLSLSRQLSNTKARIEHPLTP